MTSDLVFVCKKCNSPCSVNLILESNKTNNHPQLQIEIECGCKSKKDRKTIYDITSYLYVIGRNYDIKQKA